MGADCVLGTVCLCLSEQELSQMSPITRCILGETVYRTKPEKSHRNTRAGGGNVLIKREVYDAVGNYDKSLVMGGEDGELFARVLGAGFEVWHAPRAVVRQVTPPYRLKEDYLIWTSLRYAENFAYVDYKKWGLGGTILACIARIGQALLVNLPILFCAYLSGDDAEVLGRKCLLWRAVGYTRKTLFLIAPHLFQQERFFAGLEFRKKQEIFPKDSSSIEKGTP